MSVAITISCDAPDCIGVAAVPLTPAAFYDSLMRKTDRLLIETDWHDVPEGWALDVNGEAFCPAHRP